MSEEAAFQAMIVELARDVGWRHMHVRRTIGKGRRWTTGTSVAGWPDLTLWHPQQRRFLMRELKATDGAPTTEQRQLLHELAECNVDTGLWRPQDWPEVEHTLGHRVPASWCEWCRP